MRLSSYCTKRSNNGVNLVTSRKINTRLARPIGYEPLNRVCLSAVGLKVITVNDLGLAVHGSNLGQKQRLNHTFKVSQRGLYIKQKRF